VRLGRSLRHLKWRTAHLRTELLADLEALRHVVACQQAEVERTAERAREIAAARDEAIVTTPPPV
jgi:CO dehydrogenase/acetyl-CoA synthase beta subunit